MSDSAEKLLAGHQPACKLKLHNSLLCFLIKILINLLWKKKIKSDRWRNESASAKSTPRGRC